MNITNDQAIMKQLGINPGQVHEYSNVSVEPTKFTPTNDLGWGQEWQAEHSATWDLWANSERGNIMVEGHSQTIAQGKPDDFQSLLNNWREEHGVRQEHARHEARDDLADPQEVMARQSRGRSL